MAKSLDDMSSLETSVSNALDILVGNKVDKLEKSVGHVFYAIKENSRSEIILKTLFFTTLLSHGLLIVWVNLFNGEFSRKRSCEASFKT